MMKTNVFRVSLILILSCLLRVANATEYTVSSDSELSSLSLSAGDVVTWLDGTYPDQSIVVFGNGTSENPIVLKAETEGGVIFTGESPANIYGSYVEMEGFYWEGGSGTSDHVSFRRSGSDVDLATNCTLRNCGFNNLASEGDTKSRWIVLYGTQNIVENCSFVNKLSTGAAILVELRFQETTVCAHQIRNNYFYNITPKDGRTNSGDCEAIRVGVSTNQAVNANCTIQGNYFQSADGENEIITNKSSNNVYKNNTFRNCRGSLVMRHGSGAWVEGNYFLGEGKESSGGIRITDSYHTIINNYFQGLNNDGDQWNNSITIVAGETATGGTANGYQNVDSILIAFNTVYGSEDPIYFNDRGSNIPTGVIANNMFHTSGAVINGEIADYGSGMVYEGNIGDGASLGITDAGLIAASVSFVASGEIFMPVATSAVANSATGDYNQVTADLEGSSRPTSNKDVGAHEVSGALSTGTTAPITDNDVGTSVGCCFLDASSASISGCNIVIGPTLSVNPGSIELNNEASDTDVSVLSNVEWTVSANSDWISISSTSGTYNGTIIISASENMTESTRTGTVTFTSSDASLTSTVTINQEIFIPILEVSDSEVSFSIDEGNAMVSISSNIDWSVSDDDDWISVSSTSGSENEDLTITVTENITGAPRTGTITIASTDGDESTTVTVNQSEKSFNPNDAESITIVGVTAEGTQADAPDVLPENVNDENTVTRWSGESNDGSVYVDLDLGCIRILTSVQIYFHKGGERTSSFVIAVSSNGVDFTEVTDVITSEQVTGYQEFDLSENLEAQYVRILGYGNSVNNWNSYEEIDVYGDASEGACIITSIQDETISSISLYPNPAESQINIEGAKGASYELIDNIGTVYNTGTLESNSTVNLENLSSGIYFIKVIQDGSTTIKKILVE